MGGEMMPDLLEQLKSLVRYDADNGNFHWLARRNSHGGGVYIGDVAGTAKDGYVVLCVDQRQYRAHRLAWFFETGSFPPKGADVDHINGCRSDNRWCNLRLVTRSQNNMNTLHVRKNTSGHRGVSWRSERNKWHARIHVNKKPLIIGDFDKLSDAISARKQAEIEHYAEYLRK